MHSIPPKRKSVNYAVGKGIWGKNSHTKNELGPPWHPSSKRVVNCLLFPLRRFVVDFIPLISIIFQGRAQRGPTPFPDDGRRRDVPGRPEPEGSEPEARRRLGRDDAPRGRPADQAGAEDPRNH